MPKARSLVRLCSQLWSWVPGFESLAHPARTAGHRLDLRGRRAVAGPHGGVPIAGQAVERIVSRGLVGIPAHDYCRQCRARVDVELVVDPRQMALDRFLA